MLQFSISRLSVKKSCSVYRKEWKILSEYNMIKENEIIYYIVEEQHGKRESVSL